MSKPIDLSAPQMRDQSEYKIKGCKIRRMEFGRLGKGTEAVHWYFVNTDCPMPVILASPVGVKIHWPKPKTHPITRKILRVAEITMSLKVSYALGMVILDAHKETEKLLKGAEQGETVIQ